MRLIFDTGVPRQDILAGTFNPEIFTGPLLQVLGLSHGRTATIDNVCADSGQFFTQATYQTDVLNRVLGDEMS